MAKMDFVKFTPGTRKKITILFKMYGNTIKATANQILNDETLAEDCLQEVMLKLAKNPQNIGAYSSPQTKAYILKVTRGQAIDMWRKRKRIAVSQGLEPKGKRCFIEVNHSTKIGKYGYDESLDKYLERLDETDRAIVGMKYDFGMRHKEIAETLGKTLTAVDKRSERVKKKVKNFIAEIQDN